MNFIIYKITNNTNGKIYIGAHKTDNLDDGYMGSGKVLKRAINKYGIDSFTKEILHIFDNTEDMFNMESTLVNEEFIKRADTYNIKEGGSGGFDYINNTGKNLYGKNGQFGYGLENLDKGRETFLERMKNDEYRDKFIKKTSKGTKKYYIDGGVNTFKGKHHTDETKEKIGKANSKHQSGKGNSNYGNCWIYHPDLKQNKSIPRYELDQWLGEGWIKGRKIKF